MNNNLFTIIECSVDKNVVYTVNHFEYQLLNLMSDNWRMIYGKFPKISALIEYIKKQEVYENLELFKDIKIEEKKNKEIKGTIGTYFFVDEMNCCDSLK